MASVNPPIASLERLKQLGLNPGIYGSCSGEVKKQTRKGTVLANVGCKHHPDSGGECPLAMSVKYMKPRDATDTIPRVRNVGTRVVKPSATRPGDEVRENYMSCVQFLDDLRTRDGRNGLLAEIVCGEGGTVTLSDSDAVKDAAGQTIYNRVDRPTEVPRFPDPSEVPAMVKDLSAGKVRLVNTERKRNEERGERLGIMPVADDADDSPKTDGGVVSFHSQP